MPAVSFSYPDQINNSINHYQKVMAKKSKDKEFIKIKDEQASSNIDNLDFAYTLQGAKSITPLRVYNDGVKTYIQMPTSMKFYEAPILMILDKAKDKEIVNYRLKNDTYIVDRLFNKAVLLVNVGSNQLKCVITKQSAKNNKAIVNKVLYDLALTKEDK